MIKNQLKVLWNRICGSRIAIRMFIATVDCKGIEKAKSENIIKYYGIGLR